MLRKILALSLLTVTSVVSADTLEIGLSDSSAMFRYGVPASLAGKSEVYAEFMYNDKNSIIGGVGLLVANDEMNSPGLTIGVGAKAVFAVVKETPNRKSASALALGAQIRYELPVERRVAFSGEFYLAPRIISFGDVDRYQQYGARAEFSVSPQVQVYAGYRRIAYNIRNGGGEAVLINGPHLGVQMSF